MRTSFVGPVVAALLVAIVGGLAGWYAYLRTHEGAIRAADSARGFSTGGLIGKLSGVTGDILSGDSGVSLPGGIVPGAAILGASSTVGDATANLASATTTIQTPRLWHAAKTPIAGFGFTTTGGTLAIRYAERATGNVFSADPVSGNVERLTNTLMPKTEQALFAGDAIIERSIGDGVLATFSGTVGRNATTTALVGANLPDDISFMAIDPSTASIFYLTPTSAGTIGTVSNPDGTGGTQVFSSLLSSWRPIIVPGHLMVEQLSSDGVPGYAYEIGKKGVLNEVMGGIPGLQILPRASSTALLWSAVGQNSLALYARSAASSTEQKLSLKTIADKCVWAPATGATAIFAYCAVPRTLPPAGFLDLWHQGAYQSDDAWWQIDVGAGTSQALYATDESPDVRYPQIDPTGRFIAFIDGRDSSLWVLRIVK